MNTIPDDTMAAIMQALDEGVSMHTLRERFPEHGAAIEEIITMRNLLSRAAATIPEPVTKPVAGRLPVSKGPVESPYISNSLFFSMNYKIILPVLVLGLVAVGGAMMFSGGGGQVAQDSDTMPYAQTGDAAQSGALNTPSGSTQDKNAPTPEKKAPTKVASNESIDDVIAGFSADASNEQSAAADDGMNADMFAQAELSDFESDSYDF